MDFVVPAEKQELLCDTLLAGDRGEAKAVICLNKIAKGLRIGPELLFTSLGRLSASILDAEVNTGLYECGGEQHERCIAGAVLCPGPIFFCGPNRLRFGATGSQFYRSPLR